MCFWIWITLKNQMLRRLFKNLLSILYIHIKLQIAKSHYTPNIMEVMNRILDPENLYSVLLKVENRILIPIMVKIRIRIIIKITMEHYSWVLRVVPWFSHILPSPSLSPCLALLPEERYSSVFVTSSYHSSFFIRPSCICNVYTVFFLYINLVCGRSEICLLLLSQVVPCPGPCCDFSAGSGA